MPTNSFTKVRCREQPCLERSRDCRGSSWSFVFWGGGRSVS